MNLVYSNPYFHAFSIGFNSCYVAIPAVFIFCLLLGYFPVTKKQKESVRIAINLAKLIIPVVMGIFLAKLFYEECFCGMLQWFDNHIAMESEAFYSGILALLTLAFVEAVLILAPIAMIQFGRKIRRYEIRKKKSLGN